MKHKNNATEATKAATRLFNGWLKFEAKHGREALALNARTLLEWRKVLGLKGDGTKAMNNALIPLINTGTLRVMQVNPKGHRRFTLSPYGFLVLDYVKAGGRLPNSLTELPIVVDPNHGPMLPFEEKETPFGTINMLPKEVQTVPLPFPQETPKATPSPTAPNVDKSFNARLASIEARLTVVMESLDKANYAIDELIRMWRS